MAVTYARTRLAAAVLGLSVSLFACTVHKTEVPALTGPSGLGLNITIAASPDVLTQDGLSQSLVTITATDNTGQPKPNVQLRIDIAVGGVVADFGRLSAKTLVTDTTGHATTVYTAPPAPLVVVGNGTKVDIQVTPVDSNFDNTTLRVASIQLVPPGVVVAFSQLVPDFTAPTPNAGDPATFTGTVTDPNKTGQTAVAFSWDFGDGATGSGQTLTHTFASVGTFVVTLTIRDNLGRLASVSHAVTVGAAVTFAPTFFTNPTAPSQLVSGESIIFNASANTPPAGHTITGYFWDFGDGTGGATGAVVTHTFASPATYNVLLRVTLDNGSQPTSLTPVTINPPNPTARISIIPPTGRPGDLITFLGNQSTPAPGHQITSYVWTFGDGGTAKGSTVTHSYAITNGTTTQTFTVTLIVTDEDGNQNIATGSVTISTTD